MGGLLIWILVNYVESMKTKETHNSKWVTPFAGAIIMNINKLEIGNKV
jgi:hypothetical protein